MGDSEDVKKLLQTIITQNKAIQSDIDQIKTTLATQCNKIQQITEEVDYLEKENEELKNRLFIVEKRLKRNNIVIFGINEEIEHPLPYVINFVEEILQVTLYQQEVNNIYRIGKKTDGKQRPILLELASTIKKQNIFQKLSKLKGTGISFSNDLTPEEREEQSLLYRHLKAARQKNYNAKIVKNKLVVNGETYTYEDLKTKNIGASYQSSESFKSNSAPSTPVTHPQNLFEQIEKEEKLGQQQEKIINKNRNVTEKDAIIKTPGTAGSGSGTKVTRNNMLERDLRSKKQKM